MPTLIIRKRFIAAVLGLLCTVSAGAGELSLERDLFREVYHDIRLKRSVAEDKLDRLRDYPLYPYIEYQRLRNRLWNTDRAKLEEFFQRHPEFPLNRWLRADYLEILGKQGHWSDYLALYQGSSDAELSCYALQARKARDGVDADWLDQARQLWLVGRSQPKACDPVFKVLYARDALDRDDVWRRIELSIEAHQPALARYLARQLPTAERGWVDDWIRMLRAPATTLERPRFATASPQAARIIDYGIRRLARRDSVRAREQLTRWQERGVLTPALAAELHRYVALRAAYSREEHALEWLEALPETVVDGEVLLWRARMARGLQDWPRLLTALEALPDSVLREQEWRYWRGHALIASGAHEQGTALLRKLARERHYYGFLAADAVGEPYAFNADPVEVTPAQLARIEAQPAVRRARELLALDMVREARREWQTSVLRLPEPEQKAAAVLAADWGWYDRAIFTANRAGLRDALKLRFPTPFRTQVEDVSREYRLNPALTYALMRKESAFMADAVSPVGAMGLMQVMPQTGKRVAHRLKQPFRSSRVLLDADTNMRIGSAYLRQVLDRFGGNPILAAAAYNAGPGQVQEWLERNAGQPAAVWVENISYGETRDYVKSVLAFSVVFDWLLHGEGHRLSQFMTQMNEDADVLHFRIAQELGESPT